MYIIKYCFRKTKLQTQTIQNKNSDSYTTIQFKNYLLNKDQLCNIKTQINKNYIVTNYNNNLKNKLNSSQLNVDILQNPD